MSNSFKLDPDRPPAPALPSEPLTFEDAAERYQKAMHAFETFAAAADEIIASGSTLLEDADKLTVELLSNHDFNLALSMAMQTWFALVPIGCRAPELKFAALERTFKSNLNQMERCLGSDAEEQFQSAVMKSPQPDMVLLLGGLLLQAATAEPRELRPSGEASPVILALLKTIVEELDAALRAR